MSAEVVRENLRRIREEIDGATVRSGRDPQAVAILAVTKYVGEGDLPRLAQAGLCLLGENRAQDLQARATGASGELFTWDFIGALQSRRVRLIVPHVRLIHSVASESALRELERHRDSARPGLEILIEVNIAGEAGKAGVAPDGLDTLIELAPVPVAGLMCMPPYTEDAQESRRWFARLRELAAERGLRELSMGTSQDYVVAVEEGASIVRLGRCLYEPPA